MDTFIPTNTSWVYSKGGSNQLNCCKWQENVGQGTAEGCFAWTQLWPTDFVWTNHDPCSASYIESEQWGAAGHSEQLGQREAARMQESGRGLGLRTKWLCLWFQTLNRPWWNCKRDEAGHVSNIMYGDRHSVCDHYNRAWNDNSNKELGMYFRNHYAKLKQLFNSIFSYL